MQLKFVMSSRNECKFTFTIKRVACPEEGLYTIFFRGYAKVEDNEMSKAFPNTFPQLMVHNPDELADIGGLREAARDLSSLISDLKENKASGLVMTGVFMQSNGPDDKKTG